MGGGGKEKERGEDPVKLLTRTSRESRMILGTHCLTPGLDRRVGGVAIRHILLSLSLSRVLPSPRTPHSPLPLEDPTNTHPRPQDNSSPANRLWTAKKKKKKYIQMQGIFWGVFRSSREFSLGYF